MMRVWDAPTRLFHWLIVILVVISYVSVQKEWIQVHYFSGYTMLTALLFRLAWGIFGSETSRFSKFLRSPGLAFRHLASFRAREPDREIGHNAAGGWMVLVMLLALAVQATTGLFSGDPDGQGPLGHLVQRPTQKLLTLVHHINFNVILALVSLHILAIIAYATVKRHDLVRPMVTGKKRLPANTPQPRFANPAVALAIVVGAAALIWALVSFA
ncbi:MAG: cytochrome b/b6 domain-containing protein [Acetobacteraceae bacterium]